MISIQTGTILGVEALGISAEVVVSDSGKERFAVIGLGDNAVKEAKDRVTAALGSCGFRVPRQVLVNLSPADIRKEGSTFDLPIAAGVLAAMGHIPIKSLEHRSLFGELSLGGTVGSIRGMVALAADAAQRGATQVIVPIQNVTEARLCCSSTVVGIRSLGELVTLCKEGRMPGSASSSMSTPPPIQSSAHLGEVIGQEPAKRAMLVAAAGGHNMLMIGPPGCGKSMLAERYPSLLPTLTSEQIIEATRIHSVAGQGLHSILAGLPPIRAPHYAITEAGLLGGGSPPHPGEISLAHHGVLFLDELPEFRRGCLEALRLPLEQGYLSLSRARHSVRFPTRFQLLAAMNPCPCGKLGTAECACSRRSIADYLKKLSQPIIDRIDLHVELKPVPLELITRPAPAQHTSQDPVSPAAQIVQAARTRALQRNGGVLNAHLSRSKLSNLAAISDAAFSLLGKAAAKIGLSARGVMKVLAVSRTVADLESSDTVEAKHLAEAVSYRSLERLTAYAQAR